MKVLWFEITTPSKYRDDNKVTAGWQDSLENIVSKNENLELYVAFEVNAPSEIKVKDGVTYVPILVQYSSLERKKLDFTWNVNANKLVPKCIEVINSISPDIIHIFGNEWPFGLVAKYTSIPVVIHIQGSIVSYDNALFPPKYNNFTMIKETGFNIIKQYRLLKKYFKDSSRLSMEKKIWQRVDNYMGRTIWDLALSKTLKPSSNYWHVEEALRPVFLSNKSKWSFKRREKHILFTTGISSFWKGPDMLLKTAHILKSVGFNFEWQVAGCLGLDLKNLIEKKEGLSFCENNISILGFVGPEDLLNCLLNASLYVHTAYIENSPNSICEAQIVGLPVVSTMVGGVETLVENHREGELVPANDPWRMAYTIMQLINDENMLTSYSENSYEKAKKRHNPASIVSQLMNCYTDLILKR